MMNEGEHARATTKEVDLLILAIANLNVDSLARSTWILVWEMLIFTVSQRRRKSQRICGRRFTSMLFTLHMATICLRMMKMHCSTTWLETSSQRHKQRDG